jgi:pimeloyl-ACP methyl ester carboxylesterase
MPLLFSIGILFGSCKKETDPTPAGPENPYLVSSNLIGTYQPADLSRRLGNIPGVSLFTRFPVKVYKITYRTVDAAGTEVQASGAAVVPVMNHPAALLSHQHGTITSESGAPSNYGNSSEVWSAGTVLASSGYVVSAPDYLGYGAAKNISHPYEHRATLASASRDMLRAVRELCVTEKVALNGQLFLTGYSEGGYATMSLHKLLEEGHADEFTVTASAPPPGAYDKTEFAKYILNSDQPLSFINTYLWVLQTYNTVYGLNRPFSYYLNEPYATQVQQTARGQRGPEPAEAVCAGFKAAVLDGTDASCSRPLPINDVYDWKPTAPVALFHGTDDDFVTLLQLQHAYDAMRRRGATQVELRPIQGGNHFSSAAQFALGHVRLLRAVPRNAGIRELENYGVWALASLRIRE